MKSALIFVSLILFGLTLSTLGAWAGEARATPEEAEAFRLLDGLEAEEALAHAERILKTHPTSSRAAQVAVRALQLLGDKAKMRTRLDELIVIAQDNPYLYCGLAEATAEQDDDEAVKLWIKALDMGGGSDPDLVATVAWSVMYAGRYDTGENIVGQGLEMFPANKTLLLVQAFIYSHKHEAESEGRLYQALLDDHRDDDEVVARCAMYNLSTENIASARKILETATPNGQHENLVRFAWGLYYSAVDQGEKLEESLDDILARLLDPRDYYLALRLKALAVYFQEQYAETLPYLEKTLALEEFFPGLTMYGEGGSIANGLMGSCYFEMGDSVRAKPYLEKAVAAGDETGPYNEMLAIIKDTSDKE